MAGGSWNGGGGDMPAHPSAWCKAQQGWALVPNQTQNGVLTVADVKDSRMVYRLWDAPLQPGDRIRCEAPLAGPQRYFVIPSSVEAG